MLFMSFLLHIHIWCHKMLNKYVQGIVALTWTPLKRLLFTVSSCAHILDRKQYLMQCIFKKCVLGIVALTWVYPNMLTGLPYKASRLPDNCAIFYSTSCLSTTSFTTWWFWEQGAFFTIHFLLVLKAKGYFCSALDLISDKILGLWLHKWVRVHSFSPWSNKQQHSTFNMIL